VDANAVHAELSPVRVESTWKHVIDVYRGGILADWYVLLLVPAYHSYVQCAGESLSSDTDGLSLSEQEDEENFDLSLISSLETDVIPCLGDDRVPDYLVTRLAKVLQQGSQLLLNESDDEYPPTPSSLTKPDTKYATWGDKADSERMSSTAPVRGVSRERFSYWCLDLLFLICSDTSKGRVCAPQILPGGLIYYS
jgi:protein MON2